MKVGTFKQDPFVAGGKKLTDLPGEPSSSQVMLDLDLILVVKTKKLNKGSVFDINSPVGVAGIRGTEFQMASRPGQGVQLDVTESTVAFTHLVVCPAVSQGNGLSVSPTGVPKMRPVNPTVARKIETTNQTPRKRLRKYPREKWWWQWSSLPKKWKQKRWKMPLLRNLPRKKNRLQRKRY